MTVGGSHDPRYVSTKSLRNFAPMGAYAEMTQRRLDFWQHSGDLVGERTPREVEPNAVTPGARLSH
jgi:hypothetical protein